LNSEGVRALLVGYRLYLVAIVVTGFLVVCFFGRGIARFRYQILDCGGW
jgi:hypothetical protein